jgi:hypothetical protein
VVRGLRSKCCNVVLDLQEDVCTFINKNRPFKLFAVNQMMGLLEGKTLLVVIPCSTWNSLSTAWADWSMAPAGLAELRGGSSPL